MIGLRSYFFVERLICELLCSVGDRVGGSNGIKKNEAELRTETNIIY